MYVLIEGFVFLEEKRSLANLLLYIFLLLHYSPLHTEQQKKFFLQILNYFWKVKRYVAYSTE